jgi:hypothetical protein
MPSVITVLGEKLFAQKAQANQQLDIDTFIFANVPGQDLSAEIDRNEVVPILAQQVHTQIVQQVGRINDNVVVYSTVLDSVTGDFDFNWVGLYSSVNDTLVAINHIPTTPKTKTVSGVAGNTLNRNFGIEYSGIADLTGINVAPETWQLDFTARLSGMDELTRNLAKDLNGTDSFIDDGFKVYARGTVNTFGVLPGIAYVNGLRVELEVEQVLIADSYPKFIYLDAYFDGDASSVWKPKHQLSITDAESVDYIDGAGKQHYLVKLATITAADEVEDLRVSFTEKQDSYTRNFKTVADAKADKFLRVGQKITIGERDGAEFEMVNSLNVSVDGYNGFVITKNTLLTAVLDDTDVINVKFFGAVGDGVVDDVDALESAFSTANKNKKRASLGGRDFNISRELNLPSFGFFEGGKIHGAGCKWKFSKTINNSSGMLTFDLLVLDSIWHSSFNGKIKVLGELLLQSSNNTWGMFWNELGDWEVGGELIIDVDQGQSVNENHFGICLAKGGVRIRGIKTTGIRQAYGNSWEVLDTTGANMTSLADSSTGWHVLNDSVLNETNIIKNWDAEVSGSRGVRGNWNVQGHTVDSTNANIAVTERNWSIFGGTTNSRIDGDFIPAQAHNAAIGGEWDVLDENGDMPYSLSTFGTMSGTTTLSTTGVPSGIQKQIARETLTSFSGYQINFNFESEKIVVLALWVSGGSDFKQVETDGGIYTTGLSFVDSVSGWRLYRVVCPKTTKWIKLYLNDGTNVSYKQIRINSYFASITKATFLPALRNKTVIRGQVLNVGFGTLINIPIPLVSTGAANTQTAGILTVRVEGDTGGPSFIGAAILYRVAVVCSKVSGVTKTVQLDEIVKSVQGINTTGTPILTVTPKQAALDFQLSGISGDLMRVFWEYDPMVF